jgi:hypothetical protein
VEVVGDGGPGEGGEQPGLSVELDRASLAVEVDVGSATSWGRTPDRSWLVRLCRAERSLVIAAGLSHAVAEHVATRLSELLEPDKTTGEASAR